jgi:hypothetical protein
MWRRFGYRGQAIKGSVFDFTGDGEVEIEIDSQQRR